MAESLLPTIISRYQREILSDWIKEQTAPGAVRPGLLRDSDLRAQCEEFLRLLEEAIQQGSVSRVDGAAFARTREMLGALSRSRAELGFSPSETAIFVLSLKRPVFSRLEAEVPERRELFREVWNATQLMDNLALLTTVEYQKSREELITRQQEEMLELSTPVVKLWDGILALPLIGTLDSNRTQTVMETLLQRVVETGSEVVIIDITGVPTVDTLVAQHLLKTVAAARLMGVESIISGIRPQIAQTIVHLGVALGDVITRGSLADAFKLALEKVSRRSATAGPA